MNNSELIAKLQALDPTAQATMSVKNAAGVTTIMPVLWIAKGSIYSKIPEQTAEVVSANPMSTVKPF